MRNAAARDGRVYSFGAARRETEEEHPNGTLNWGPVIEPVGPATTATRIVEPPLETTATS